MNEVHALSAKQVNPTDRVTVIGIGGLGHMALQFLNKWGCHVTAFTSSASKADEAKRMGAHAVLNTRSAEELKQAGGKARYRIVLKNDLQ